MCCASQNLVKKLVSNTIMCVLCVHVAAALYLAPCLPPLTVSLLLSLYVPREVVEQSPLYMDLEVGLLVL